MPIGYSHHMGIQRVFKRHGTWRQVRCWLSEGKARRLENVSLLGGCWLQQRGKLCLAELWSPLAMLLCFLIPGQRAFLPPYKYLAWLAQDRDVNKVVSTLSQPHFARTSPWFDYATQDICPPGWPQLLQDQVEGMPALSFSPECVTTTLSSAVCFKSRGRGCSH